MTKRAASYTAIALAVASLGSIAAVSPATAHASETGMSVADRTPVVVGLGDSFMSGEGGRYAGNIYSQRSGDGAYDTGPHDRGWGTYVDQYGTSLRGDYKSGKVPAACHRSDTSIVNTVARDTGWQGINLACSGAITDQVTKQSFKGQAPQVTQLDAIAGNRSKDIKAVLISIGGNDMGFSSILSDCLQVVRANDCSASKTTVTGYKNATKALADKEGVARIKITETLDAVTDVMRKNGYADGSYRFVYDGAPKLFEPAPNRYPAKDGWFQGSYKESPGVPFHEKTVEWSSRVAVPMLNKVMRDGLGQSKNKQIQFMDLTEAFRGHTLSNKQTKQYVRTVENPRPEVSEWIVPISKSYIVDHLSGDPRESESYHPNSFGQRMIGKCLVAAVTADSRSDFSCTGVPSKFDAEAVSAAAPIVRS